MEWSDWSAQSASLRGLRRRYSLHSPFLGQGYRGFVLSLKIHFFCACSHSRQDKCSCRPGFPVGTAGFRVDAGSRLSLSLFLFSSSVSYCLELGLAFIFKWFLAKGPSSEACWSFSCFSCPLFSLEGLTPQGVLSSTQASLGISDQVLSGQVPVPSLVP